MLLSDDGLVRVAIMTATGKSKICVRCWQERLVAEGVDDLLPDRRQPFGFAPPRTALGDRVVALTLKPPGHEATHRTVVAMAKAVGSTASLVVRIGHDHTIAPRRSRNFKLFNKAFAEKLNDMVDLYVSLPAHGIVLLVDEKTPGACLHATATCYVGFFNLASMLIWLPSVHEAEVASLPSSMSACNWLQEVLSKA